MRPQRRAPAAPSPAQQQQQQQQSAPAQLRKRGSALDVVTEAMGPTGVNGGGSPGKTRKTSHDTSPASSVRGSSGTPLGSVNN